MVGMAAGPVATGVDDSDFEEFGDIAAVAIALEAFGATAAVGVDFAGVGVADATCSGRGSAFLFAGSGRSLPDGKPGSGPGADTTVREVSTIFFGAGDSCFGDEAFGAEATACSSGGTANLFGTSGDSWLVAAIVACSSGEIADAAGVALCICECGLAANRSPQKINDSPS